MARVLRTVVPVILALSICNTAAATAQCGPAGDPPAEVQSGWVSGFIARHNPVCFGGDIVGPWRDSSGVDRYACLYQPEQAGKDNPLPLVVFLHGSIATADSVLVTGLTRQIGNANLNGGTAGFILLAPEGRYTTHFYPGSDRRALGWDNWYRQLDPSGDVTIAGKRYPENADAAAIDYFVHEQLLTGRVDPSRIYVMGWSNGAAMAILYALNRPWIAAAAVYSAPDPFGAFNDPCPQTPVAGPPAIPREVRIFNPRVPIMHVRNDCDIGGICPNGDALASRLSAVNADLDDVIIDFSGERVRQCDSACGTASAADGSIGFFGAARGLFRHLRWPWKWTPRMLDFLRAHPLATMPAHIR